MTESQEFACPCGCPPEMHVGEIGCPCALPGEPPCRVEVVDGEPVRVQGAGEWDDADRAAFAEVVRAAKRKMEEADRG